MSENAPNLFEKTTALPDALTLFVGGKVFNGWVDLSVTRELNAGASDFSVQLTDKWAAEKEAWRLTANSSARISLGQAPVLTGFIDKISSSISKSSRGFTARGRSNTCDLVDCSVTGENSYKNLNLKELAIKVCKPFGITPTFLSDPGDPFPAITVQQGETVFALLDRLARQRKLLIYPGKNGGIIFSKAIGTNSTTHLVEGVNILSGSSEYDFTNRFSEYQTKGQNIGWMQDGKQSTQAQGTATDLGVGRYRPLIVLAEGTSDDGQSENRAAYEAALRKAQSLVAEIQVQGFYQKDGTLWDINQFVFVDCGSLGLRRWLLVKKVTYNKSNGGGTTTTLGFCLPDSFNFDKEKKKENPLGWAKPLDANKAPVKDK